MTISPKISNNDRTRPILNTPIPAPLVYQNETKNEKLWEPLEKQIIEQTNNNQPTTTIIPTPTATTYDNKIAALHAIKQKFMPKEITALPWDKYRTTTTTTNSPIVQNEKKQKHHRYGNQYDQMIQDLAVSHAWVAAANFETMSIVEADQLAKKTCQLKKQLDCMYDKLRLNINTTRVSVKSFKLHTPQNTEIIQLQENICHTERELEEFYFMNKYANHVETRYLQHLAGILSYNDHRINEKQLSWVGEQESKNERSGFLSILHKLQSTFDVDNEEQLNSPQLSPSSTSSHVTASSSTSSLATTSLFDSANRVTTDQSTNDILHQIDLIFEKVSHQFKQQKAAVQSFESQNKNADTMDELIKQRERSAELVLQLEKNRSQRLLLSKKKDVELNKLKEQLNKETILRKSLKTRITTLEQEVVGKEKLINSYDLELRNLKDQTDNDKDKIIKLQADLESLQQKSMNDQTQNEEKSVSQEKTDWINKQNRILKQCSFFVENLECADLEDAVNQLVCRYRHDRKVLKELQENFEEAEKRVLDRQSDIDQLETEKKSLMKDLKIVAEKCCAEIGHGKKVDKSNIVKAVEELIQALKIKDGVGTSVDQDHAEQYRIKHSNSLLKLKQQELIQLQEKFDNIIKTYTTRESAFILQSASTEAELERILKEYDRLTRNITDFNNERKKLEDEIRKLQVEKIQLSRQLRDEQILKIHGNDGVLRKEFRDLMATVKEKHKVELLKEIDTRREVEHMLREKMSEIESKRWERVDTAVQTHLQLT